MRKNTIMVMLGIAVAALLVAVVAKSATGPSVAFVDVQRVFAESTATKGLVADTPQKTQKKKTELDEAVAIVRKGEADKDAAEILGAKRDVEKRIRGELQELQRTQADAANRAQDRLSLVIGEFATARRIALVLPISGRLLYAAPGTDLTSEAIARLDGTPPELAIERAKLEVQRRLVEQLERGGHQ